jgi:Protein of unknown function (DUF2934)
MQDHKDETIRRRAYAIWEAEGRPEGRHEQHWAQAETEGEGGAGFAERQHFFESASSGAGDLTEAEAQAGEGVPKPKAPPFEGETVGEPEGQPIAAAPDRESEALLAEGDGPARRGGHTGP